MGNLGSKRSAIFWVPSWVVFRLCQAYLGASSILWRASMACRQAVLGSLWLCLPVLGHLWDDVDLSWGCLRLVKGSVPWVVLVRLGRSWGRLGRVLNHFGKSWRSLGFILECFGGCWVVCAARMPAKQNQYKAHYAANMLKRKPRADCRQS